VRSEQQRTMNESASTHPRAPLVLAIESLARAARFDLSISAIERAQESCRSLGETPWEVDVARVASALELRVQRIDLSVKDLVRGASDDVMPLVLIAERPEGAECITVLERSGRRVRVRRDDDPTVVAFDEASLAAFLGVSSDVPLGWVVADPHATFGHDDMHGHPSPLRRLFALVRLERDDLGVVVIYAAGVGLLSLATPLAVQFLVNTVAFGALLQPLVVLTLLVLAGLALESLLVALQYWVIERVQQRLFVRVALDVAYRLPHVRQSELDDRHAPELVNRFFDVMTLQKGAGTLLSEGVAIILSSIVGMLILAFYHPFLLAFDVVLVVGLAFVVLVLGRRAIGTSIGQSEAKYAVAAWLEQAATHRTTLSLGDGPAYVGARAESLTREWLDRRRKHWRVVFRQITSALALRACASAALLGLGGWLVLSRQLTLGQLIAAELVVTSIVASFAKFGKAFESFYDLVAATDKLGYLVDLETFRKEGGELPSRTAGLDIVAHGVDVARASLVVAEEVDLHLPPGSRTVLHGSAGSGKSTLADVLVGLRPVVKGRLLVDGIPTGDLSSPAQRREMALVREAEIIAGTLFENVAMGRPLLDRKAVRAALASVGLDELVDGLPQGLDTYLPHDGLLGGTGALRLTIARAIAGNARLLVLDGALDRLDDGDRRAVWRAVSQRDWTILVTTSRRELLELAEAGLQLSNRTLTKTARGMVGLSRPAVAHPLHAEEA
jgi:putative ABC transport system ATP-binding protein